MKKLNRVHRFCPLEEERLARLDSMFSFCANVYWYMCGNVGCCQWAVTTPLTLVSIPDTEPDRCFRLLPQLLLISLKQLYYNRCDE